MLTIWLKQWDKTVVGDVAMGCQGNMNSCNPHRGQRSSFGLYRHGLPLYNNEDSGINYS